MLKSLSYRASYEQGWTTSSKERQSSEVLLEVERDGSHGGSPEKRILLRHCVVKISNYDCTIRWHRNLAHDTFEQATETTPAYN